MDLYRLGGDFDLGVLDIPRVLATSVCLIEWPDRLGASQPDNRLGENVSMCQFAIDMIFPMAGHRFAFGMIFPMSGNLVERLSAPLQMPTICGKHGFAVEWFPLIP